MREESGGKNPSWMTRSSHPLFLESIDHYIVYNPDLDTSINPLHLWLIFNSSRLRQDTQAQNKTMAMRPIGFRQSTEHRPCGYFRFCSPPVRRGLWSSLQCGRVPFPGSRHVRSFRDHSSIDFSCCICICVKFPLLWAQSKSTMLLISSSGGIIWEVRWQCIYSWSLLTAWYENHEMVYLEVTLLLLLFIYFF